MVSIRQRNDPVRIFWRRMGMLALTVFILFGIWAVFDVYLKERESRELRIQAEAQLEDLRTREVALKERISQLETVRGQEAELRNAYQVGKEGEGMITIVDEPAATASPKTQPQKSLLQRIFWWW